jgi:hypothetical protein
MPTWNIIEALKLAGKFTLIALLSGLMFDFTMTFKALLIDLIHKIGGSWDGVNNIDLGYVGGLIGLDDFLNAIVSMLDIAGTFAITGILSIFAFKFTLIFYRSIMTT